MKILNFGSLNIDITYRVPHMVQPGETIRALHYERFCGGKGLNQSIALAQAGAEVFHAGCIGVDGEILNRKLEQAGVNTRFLRRVEGPSGHAIIQIDEKGQNSIVICGGANELVDVEYIEEVFRQFGENDVLLVQNEIANVDFAINVAAKKNMRVVLNPSPFDDTILRFDLNRIDCFILNEVEGQQMTQCAKADPMEILDKIQKRYPRAACVLTFGKKGAYFSYAGQTIFQPAFQVKTIDSTGAGDTFTGFFITEFLKNKDPKAALRYASAAAALSVGKKGASSSIPANAEVQEFLERVGIGQ